MIMGPSKVYIHSQNNFSSTKERWGFPYKIKKNFHNICFFFESYEEKFIFVVDLSLFLMKLSNKILPFLFVLMVIEIAVKWTRRHYYCSLLFQSLSHLLKHEKARS